MKPKFIFRAFLCIASSSLLSIPQVHAADGTWLGNSGAWSDTTTNPTSVWFGGTPADGFDSTAFFTGVDIAADQIINLVDAPRTIGNITFTDLTTSSNNLTISGANILTLDRTSGAPLIDVTQSDRTLTISSVVAGNDGLQKNGLGTLTLSGANTYTGTTTISAGELKLQGSAFFTAARTYSISSGAVLNLNGGASIPIGTTTISGTGTLRFSAGGISAGDDGRDITMSLGVGSLIDIQSGASIYNGGWQAINWSANKATLNVNGELNLADGNSVTADALTGAGTIGSSTTGGSTTLTVGNSNGSGSFGGSIIHGLTVGLFTGTRVVALTKSGTGTQTLSGNNSYTGTTAITGGILAISHNNALGSSATGNTTIAASGSSAGPQLRLSNNITSAENITLTGNSDQTQFNGVIYNTSGINTLSGNITLASPTGPIRITSGGGEMIFSGTISQTGTTRNLVLQALTGASLTVNNAIANNNGALNILGNAFGAASNGVTLKAASTAIGNTNIGETGLLKLGVTDAIKTTANLNFGFAFNFAGSDQGTLDLAGFNQTVAALTSTKNSSNIGADSTRVVTNSATGTSLLTVGNGNASGTFNGVIVDGGVGKVVALTKIGSGTQTLTAANTYSGNTTVSGGTLSLASANANNQTSTVTIAASGATLNLTYGGTDTVDKLFIGATQLAAGVYGNSSSVLPIIARSEITGTGTLTVSSGPGGGNYAAWQSLNGAGANLSDDHDNDGVDNGTEYFIGGPTGPTTGFTALPGVINNLGTLSVTWPKAAGYTGAYGTHYFVETSDTLVGAWTTEAADPNPGFTVTFPSATEVKYTFPNPLGTKNFARLKVTGP